MTVDKEAGQREEGIEVPWERINPETLRALIEEFVTREWSDLGDAGFSLEDKIGQVRQQLQDGKVEVLFDLTTETANIVPCRSGSRKK